MPLDFGVTPGKRDELYARMAACGLRDEDCDEQFVRSGGRGGQKVNKTATCVRLVHRTSGLEVKMQRARTQGLNRYYARKRMCELLEEKSGQSPRDAKLERIRKQKSRRKRRSPSRSRDDS